jgi:hypothetical protein
METLKLAQSQEDAAISGGVSPRTMQNWLARGRSATTGEYFQFVQDCERAIVEGKSRLVKIVQAHAIRKPELALKVLARRFPEWGVKATLAVEQKETVDDTAVLDKLERGLAEIARRQEMAKQLGPGLRQIAEEFGQ